MTFFQPSAVLMCEPRYFDVCYDINPWMTGNISRVNLKLAQEQWLRLRDALAKTAEVLELPAESGVPDLVFTANAGTVWNNLAIVSRFSQSQRQAEEAVFASWFSSRNLQVKHLAWYFEGQGDLLPDAKQRFWLGTGFRSVPEAACEIEPLLNAEVQILELVDPRWYHLDTAFCPLPSGELIWYPGAFSPASRDLIKKHFPKTLAVTESDAEKFICNSVVIDKEIFMPSHSDVSAELKELGYWVQVLDVSEFQLAGGAIRCLVLNL